MFMLITCFLIAYLVDPAGAQGAIFFSHTEDFFADYFNVHDMAYARNPYWFGLDDPLPCEHAYPPLCYVIVYLLSRLDWGIGQSVAGFTAGGVGYSAMELVIACVFMTITAILFFMLLREGYRKKGALGLLLPAAFICSSVFLFSFERGNIVILAVDFTMFFILAYRSENRAVREFALISLAVATALKGYPALMGMLLLFDRRYAAAIRAAVYSVVLVFAPFLVLIGGFGNIPIWIQNIHANSLAYGSDTARFGLRALTDLTATPVFVDLRPMLSLSDKLICVVALVTSFFQERHWKRVMLMALALICIQANSSGYLGLYLFFPIVLFFNEEHAGVADIVCLVCFILFLNPFQIPLPDGTQLTKSLMTLSVDTLYVLLTAQGVMATVAHFRTRSRKPLPTSR